MKPIFLTVTLVCGLVCGAFAESTPSKATISKHVSGTHLAKSSLSSKRSTPVNVEGPQVTGALPAIADRGLVMISPLAPAKEGYGEHFLVESVNPQPQSSRRSTMDQSQYGGIKLFGWEF